MNMNELKLLIKEVIEKNNLEKFQKKAHLFDLKYNMNDNNGKYYTELTKFVKDITGKIPNKKILSFGHIYKYLTDEQKNDCMGLFNKFEKKYASGFNGISQKL